MYIKLINGTPENYSVAQLRADNPQTSFPSTMSDLSLAEWGVYPLLPVDPPAYEPLTQDLTEGTPIQQEGQWVQTWIVTQATDEEVAQRKAERDAWIEAQRAEAYRNESDPIFFKSQRGEATHQQWLDKVAEIKARDYHTG